MQINGKHILYMLAGVAITLGILFGYSKLAAAEPTAPKERIDIPDDKASEWRMLMINSAEKQAQAQVMQAQAERMSFEASGDAKRARDILKAITGEADIDKYEVRADQPPSTKLYLQLKKEQR